MKVLIATYNDGGETWNAEVEETSALHYGFDHTFSESGEFWVLISDDSSGTKAQKYNAVNVNDNYMGTSKITIEDPDTTDILFGRIIKAEAMVQGGKRFVMLFCRDWLSQLDEKQETYDMREPLDGAGLRESTLHGDADNATIVDVTFWSAPDLYVYDDDMDWAADQFNNMFLVLSDKMAGKKTWRTFPYQGTKSAGVTGDEDSHVLWIDDALVAVMFKNDDWEVEYDFHVYLGEDTPSDFYVHSSITGARVIARWQIGGGANNHSHVEVEDVGNPGEFFELATLPEDDHFEMTTFTLNAGIWNDVIDTNGKVVVRFRIERAGGNASLALTFLAFEVDVETTGYSGLTTILDTLDLNGDGGKVNCLKVNKNFSQPAARLWEAVPYSIAKESFKHIDTDEGGTIISDGDTIVVLTAAAGIEHTSGVSTRKFVNKTRLEMMRILAIDDKAVFWLTNGDITVNWKSTFAGGIVETLTDAEILPQLTMTQDYDKIFNSITFDGMRIGKRQLTSTQSDATSIDVFNATRSKIQSGHGVVSEYDCESAATAILNRHKDMQKMIRQCVLRGNCYLASHPNTIKLGDEITLNSSYLGVNAAYIVARVVYDSRKNTSVLTLHPRLSETGLQEIEEASMERALDKHRKGTSDEFIPQNVTETLA